MQTFEIVWKFKPIFPGDYLHVSTIVAINLHMRYRPWLIYYAHCTHYKVDGVDCCITSLTTTFQHNSDVQKVYFAGEEFWATVAGRVTAKVVLNVVHLWKTLWIFDISTVVLFEPKFDVIKPMQMHFCTSQWMETVLGHTVFRWCMHNIPTTQWKMHRIQFWLSNMIETSMYTVHCTIHMHTIRYTFFNLRSKYVIGLVVGVGGCCSYCSYYNHQQQQQQLENVKMFKLPKVFPTSSLNII